MLQGMEPEVGERLRFGIGEDRHHSALLAKFVGTQHFHLALSYQLSALGYQLSVRNLFD